MSTSVLPVSDVELAAAFYRDRLGFRIDCSAHPMSSPPRRIPRASAEIM
ncbi:hypothetical protein [Brachybacterium sp. J153]